MLIAQQYGLAGRIDARAEIAKLPGEVMSSSPCAQTRGLVHSRQTDGEHHRPGQSDLAPIARRQRAGVVGRMALESSDRVGFPRIRSQLAPPLPYYYP